MIAKLSIVTFLAIFCCETNVWNGIVPLKSTRSDVEKILGAPLPYSKAKFNADYETRTERVSVAYSTGPCDRKPTNGWNIPELTVIRIDVEPKARPPASSAKFDFSKFIKSSDPENKNILFYFNEQEGINITVDTSENEIIRYSYFPRSGNEPLRCKPEP